MGAAQDGSFYLPPLDQCLEGRQMLISWRNIYTSLSDPSCIATKPAIDRALKDNTIRALLVDPCSAFAAATPSTKSQFETGTSAVSAPSCGNSQYNIAEIKEDSLWLSKEANIDEVTALRVALLEWQQRAAHALLTRWYEEEVQSLQNTAAAPGLHALSDLVTHHGGLYSEGANDAQTIQTARRKALFLLQLQEHEYLVKSAETIAGIAQRADLQAISSTTETSYLASQDARHAAESMWKLQHAKEDRLHRHVENIRNALGLCTDSQGWPSVAKSEDSVASAYTAFQVERILSHLRLVQIDIMATRLHHPDAAEIRLWYTLMDETNFLSSVASIQPELVAVNKSVQILVCMISAELLRLSPTLNYIRVKFGTQDESLYPDLHQSSYLEDEDCVRLITGCLLGAAVHGIDYISPAILAWSIICQTLRMSVQPGVEGSIDVISETSRRSSFRSSGPTKLSKPEVILNSILDIGSNQQDPITEMGTSAVNSLRVFDVLPTMLDAVSGLYRLPGDAHTVLASKMTAFDIARHAAPLVAYGAEIVQTLLATMSHDTHQFTNPNGRTPISSYPSQPAQTLHEDQDVLGPVLMTRLVSRYPYELDTFLLCLGAIGRSAAYMDEEGSQIARLLESLTSFTSLISKDFDGYDLVQDDELSNCIQLSRSLPILIPLHNRQPRFKSTDGSLIEAGTQYSIPAGTIGVVLNETKPLIVSWQYSHSGLEYLGALLSTLSPNAYLSDTRSATGLDLSTAADILTLINSMLLGALSSNDSDAAEQLLSNLSAGLARNDDIVRVIFDIFEDQLQSHMSQPGAEGSILLLTRAVEFARLMLDVSPERLWTILSKSKLLPVDDSAGALSSIVGSTEIPLGQFTFLHACVSLFRSLIDDCVNRAVSRRSSADSKALARFEEQTARAGNTPEKTRSSLLFSFSRVILDLFQSQPGWRFNNPLERYNIVCGSLGSLNELLTFTCGKDGQQGPNRLFAGFQAAAANITSAYLVENMPDMASQALLDIFINTLVGLSAGPDSRDNHELVAAAVQTIKFCSSLLRTGLLQGKPGTALRNQIFKAVPLLSRLYVAHDAFKSHVAGLFTILIQYSDTTADEPPSLLGYLPTETAKSFLKVVTEITRPLQNLETEAIVWDMLSAVVSHKQQWLAISLLTGSTPRERLLKTENTCGSGSDNKSLIAIALNKLSTISALPPRRAIAILAFLSHAQRHWTWVSISLLEHDRALSSLINWLSELSPNPRLSDVEACIRNANENQCAAFIADILARLLHNISGADKALKVKEMVPKLKYLRDNAVLVNGYNHSLHTNLARNFEQRYPLCSLDDFKRSSFATSQLGRDYYYDLELADKVLGFDSAWRRSNGQGFIDEIARANVNFSLVESQIALLKSWKTLALAVISTGDAQAQTDMITVVSGCLKANIDNTAPAQIFENVSELRAELAFALLQSLVRKKTSTASLKDILPLAWDTVRQSELDFEVIANAKDAGYYRTLLQILFLAMQPHAQETGGQTKSQARETMSKSASTVPIPLSPLSATFLEIISKVIARNFRALCSTVHSTYPAKQESSLVEPADFVLLTAMMQTILRTASAATMQRQIATAIAESGLLRYASSLYSWSDSLTPDDPVYGELSILFLLTLSGVPLVAEQMAVEGVLSSLSSANISQYFRAPSAGTTGRGGKGPFDHPARLHAIWARGILPLALNILSAVGPGVASDVAAFLGSFPAQLARCESDLAAAPSSRKPFSGSITLGLAAEVHSTALLAAVIDSLRAQGAAVGINPADVEVLPFDRAALKGLVDDILKARRSLRDRIVPLGERETQLARTKGKSADSESLLEEMVVAELKGAASCLGPAQ